MERKFHLKDIAMSEFQYVAFRAIDAPVSKQNLKYMREQSTRAEITEWAFDNEYHFGDFHGNAVEMLRLGYDFHLHYANFGIRKLMIRVPELPAEAKEYLIDEQLCFTKDKRGQLSGILTLDLSLEPGHLDDVWAPAELMEELLPLRGEILGGDLRPLYLAHLAIASDMNHDPAGESDGPIPAGLNKLTPAQKAFADFYGIDKALLSAAAQGAPPLAQRVQSRNDFDQWLEGQPDEAKTTWLKRLTEDDGQAVRAEIVSTYRKSQKAAAWPTAKLDRTIEEILEKAEQMRR